MKIQKRIFIRAAVALVAFVTVTLLFIVRSNLVFADKEIKGNYSEQLPHEEVGVSIDDFKITANVTLDVFESIPGLVELNKEGLPDNTFYVYDGEAFICEFDEDTKVLKAIQTTYGILENMPAKITKEFLRERFGKEYVEDELAGKYSGLEYRRNKGKGSTVFIFKDGIYHSVSVRFTD